MTRVRFAILLGILVSALIGWTAVAQESQEVPETSGPVFVSQPVVPTLTRPFRDLPDYVPDPNAYGLEALRRQDYGFIPIEYNHPPQVDPLIKVQQDALAGPHSEAFSTLIHNYAGQSSTTSPPDTVGDVGPTFFIQGTNQSVSTVAFINKSTGSFTTKTLQSLASSSPCNSGYCDPVVNYDRVANRWILTELPQTSGPICVYVSTSGDPLGTYYAYSYSIESGLSDYEKVGVWPQNGNGGSYLVGVNQGSSGRDIIALDRGKMLAGQPGVFQKFTVPSLANAGFQLVLPPHMEGSLPPPNGEPAIFARPHDDENADSPAGNTPSYDWLDLWALSVDWTTPANSTLTKLTNVQITDYDMTLCGMGGTWNCMPQPGTTQKIDPIREPLHFPLHYRNFSDHQALVGCFVEDCDGTDHAALRWFELRKPESGGSWTRYQEGLIGGDAQHRSVGSISMDQSGNIAIGYTRTGASAPYYPSILYSGRLATDTLGTMPNYDLTIQAGTASKTSDERWGDYSGMAVDPDDDCTFWFTTEYITASPNSCGTRVAAFKFDACGCLAVPVAPVASISVPQNNRIAVSWNDSATTTITQYLVFRSTTTGGPYTQIATVADTSPGVGGGPGYTYTDDTVSGGTRYYYVVKSTDGVSCTSAYSNEVNALATGTCTLAPTFAGLTSVTNAAASTCTLNLAWSAGTAQCSGPLRYNIYRSTTTGFTPGSGNRIVQNLNAIAYSDIDQLVSGTTYYYVVRAVDSSNSSEETNTVEKNGIPTGSYSTGTWTDDAGDTGSAKLTCTAPWSVATSGGHTGVKVYQTGTYGNSQCVDIRTPSLQLGTSSQLTFWSHYDLESGWDKGEVQVSTNGGSTWTRVPVNYPTSSSDASDACGLPSGVNYFTGTNATWASYTGSLSTWNSQSVLLRWVLSTDSSGTATGWWVDDISITNVQVPGTCASGSSCANNPTAVDVTPNGPLTLCTGTGQLLTATPTGGTGLTYQWTKDGSDISGATSPTTTVNDTGTHAYNCKVKGTGCSTALTDGSGTSITWQSAPTFAGLTSVTNPQNATCTLNLGWSAGSSPCGAVTYNVYRSISSGFTPGVANRIASYVSGISYSDASSLVSGTTYYYVVRAITASNGVEETNLVQMSGAPTGSVSTNTHINEGFEVAAPTGWTHSAGQGTDNWARSTAQKHGGTSSFFCSDVTSTKDDYLVSPSFTLGTSGAMSFWHTYAMESGYDGCVIEINPGTGWVDLGSNITVGGYSGTIGGSGPLAGRSAWTGNTSIGAFTQVSVDLSSYATKTCQIRFRLACDASLANIGWYVDDLLITSQTATSCSTGSSGPRRVPYSVTPTKATTTTHGTDMAVTWDVANCASTNYHIIWGQGDNVATLDGSSPTISGGKCAIGTTGTYNWTLAPTPSGTKLFIWYLVVGDNGGTTEGSWGVTSPGGLEEGRTTASGSAAGCGCTVHDNSAACSTS